MLEWITPDTLVGYEKVKDILGNDYIIVYYICKNQGTLYLSITR